MKINNLILWLLLVLLLLSACGGTGESGGEKAPYLGKYIQDRAGLMNKADALELEQMLADLDKNEGIHLGVATLEELGEQTLDAATQSLASEMGVADREVNNGCMVLISEKDRKVKIEVAYGLEWQIPDSLSGLILNYQMLPDFKNNDYYQGLKKGLTEIAGYAKEPSWEVDFGSFGELLDSTAGSEGKIVKFHGKAPNASITNALMEEQFSPQYAVNVETIYGETVKLYFSRYMVDMVDRVAAWNDGVIVGRIRNTNPWEIELLGIQ